MRVPQNSKLFSPFDIGGHTIKNRIIMPAMHLGLCENGIVSEQELNFYQARAQNDVGLITVGLCNTYDDDNSTITGVLSLSQDAQISSMAKLHGVINTEGAKSAVQLSPITGYNNPAWVPNEPLLHTLIESIGKGAKRAQSAGFNFVELMLSGGSLLSHLASPQYNQYNLANYSGSFENRIRAAQEAMKSIQTHAPGMPIIVRIHGHEFLEEGYGLDGAAAIAKAMQHCGACAINVTVAGHRTLLPQITRHRSASSFSYLGRNIKDAVSVPVFFGGRIRTLGDTQSVLTESGADAITVGRSLIADDA